MAARLAALTLLIGAALIPSPALAADNAPLAREPGVHEVLSRSPAAVTLAFAWDLDFQTSRLYVLDPKGDNIASSAPTVSGTNLTVELDFDLKPGTYSVYYRTTDRTGGVIGGAYQFAIRRGAWSKLKTPASWAGPAEQPKIFSGSNPNQPASKDDPSASSSATPGLEVVRKDGTVEHFGLPKRTKPGQSGGSNLPWYLGGGVLLVAGAAAATVFARRRSATTPAHSAHRTDPPADSPPDPEG